MLKQALTIAIITTSLNTVTHAAGIPVIDVGSIVQAKLNIDESKKRLNELKSQVKAQTGNAGLGKLVADQTVKANLNKYMSSSDINNAVKTGNVGALQTMYDKVKADEANFEGKGKERLAATLLVNQAQINGLLATIDTRNAKIESIMQQIDATTDLASKADLANALAAEQALVNAEMNRMQVLMKQGDLNAQAAERQASVDVLNRIRGR